jgi:putative intracellular protease/amidase
MGAAIDILNPDKPKHVAIVASNPATSKQTGWPIGFWWRELTHPYWELREKGYNVDIYSSDGGKLVADSWSDPRNENKYSATDLISLCFICSPEHSKLVENSTPISQLNSDEHDALLLLGDRVRCTPFTNTLGYTYWASSFYKTGKTTAVLCHATCILLKTKLDGKLLVEGKTWTGFANSDEAFADSYVGKSI